MKIKYLLLLTVVFALSSQLAAQTRPLAPDVVVKNLYAAHNAKRGPFFQTKNRALVNQYFQKELADLIWKDAVGSKGEVGVLNFDPMYNAQDIRIKGLKIAKPMYGEGNLDLADVEVTFTNFKQGETILFRLERDKTKRWKISNISYPSIGTSLRDLFLDAADTVSGTAEGTLHKGTTTSHILYVGYCFDNDSDAGRTILAVCNDREQCYVRGDLEPADCKPEGVEADLSDSGRITKVKTVRSVPKRN
jgi:hypothetical protein